MPFLRLFAPAGQKVVVNHAESYGSGLKISIDWMTRPNQNYQVEATTDLSSPASWADFGEKIIGDGGLRSVGDLIGETRAQFYRVHILPQSSTP